MAWFRSRHVLPAAALSAWLVPAHAQQRAAENAVSEAEDAFGVTIGRETLGLYSSGSVRGFSPTAAGNARIDGLYFDQVWALNSRLRRTTTIRVGPSAQSYPFPAPTGIVDHSLKNPGGDRSLSVVVSGDEWGSAAVEIDGVVPLRGDDLSLALGAAFTNEEYYNGTDGRYGNVGGVLRWSPSKDLHVRAFAARSEARDDETGPIFVPAGPWLPPPIERRRFRGPHWADYDSTVKNHGLVASYSPRQNWQIRAGVFQSLYDDRATYANLMLDLQPDGSAQQLVIADPHTGDVSTSGEVRATYTAGSDRVRHTLHFGQRARERRRHYGGSDTLDIGNTHIDAWFGLEKPDFVFGSQTHDRITQNTTGVAYELRLARRAELGVGLQRTWYAKSVSPPEGAEVRSKDDPWLYNLSAALNLTKRLTAYASHARGLEEAGVAPDSASNRSEALPAIHTRQSDAGARFLIGSSLRLLAGVFEVRKPYFTLDEDRRYAALGDVTHRGLEVSLSGSAASGLDLVVGAVAMDPQVSGPDVESGLVGPDPVGQSKLTLLATADWRPEWFRSISIDVSARHLSARPATRDNGVELPSRTILDAGARYRFDLGGAPATVRLQITNVTDEYGFDVRGSGAYEYIPGRKTSVYLAVDL